MGRSRCRQPLPDGVGGGQASAAQADLCYLYALYAAAYTPGDLIYCDDISAKGHVTRSITDRSPRLADGLHSPNGMVFTPDGKTLIVAEPLGQRLTAFDVQADGSLAHRRVYARLPGDVSPDGIALDAEGTLWLANPEGPFSALRVPEGGEIVERVEVDTERCAVMLGEPERRHLFICGSDSNDPAEIVHTPSATLRVVEVAQPGAGRP